MKPNRLHILKECMAKTHHHQERDLPAVVAAYDFSGRRFLLVDDNALNREIAVALLTEVGGVVDEAEDGRQAVEIFAAAPEGLYDMIFMDMQNVGDGRAGSHPAHPRPGPRRRAGRPHCGHVRRRPE